MHGSFFRAQIGFDSQLPSYCWGSAQTTPAEALRGRCLRAALAGQRHVGSIEAEVTEHDGECLVRFDFWPVQWDERAKLADALEALAREVRPMK